MADRGPTGKSSFIETEKVSFVERFHGENNKLNIFRLFKLEFMGWADQLEDFPASYFNSMLHSFYVWGRLGFSFTEKKIIFLFR